MSKQVSSNKRDYNKERQIQLKDLKVNYPLQVDNRRQITNKEKESIWNSAPVHPLFDPKIFRKDILGKAAIKKIPYSDTHKARVFSVEYEHFVPHSIGGPSNTSNVCLLNAGVNRSKGKAPIYQHNYNEIKGLIHRYTVHFEDLQNNLQNKLHRTCERYNLLFVLDENIWTIARDYQGYYKGYNNQYCIFPMDIHVDNRNDALIAATCMIIIFKCVEYGVNKIIKRERIKWYDRYFIPEILGVFALITVTIVYENERKK